MSIDISGEDLGVIQKVRSLRMGGGRVIACTFVFKKNAEIFKMKFYSYSWVFAKLGNLERTSFLNIWVKKVICQSDNSQQSHNFPTYLPTYFLNFFISTAALFYRET